jgi:hypothetical protein
MKLTDAFLRNLKNTDKAQKLSDGDGLFKGRLSDQVETTSNYEMTSSFCLSGRNHIF